MTERAFQKDVVKWLRAQHDVLLVHVSNGGAWGVRGRSAGARKGVADLILCVRGQFVAIELKAPGGKQKPEQKDFEADVFRAMGRYVVARSLEDVQLAVMEARA
ncbi:MAG: VRR-NUC domain-containing protein [Pseudomonadota bacterium]